VSATATRRSSERGVIKSLSVHLGLLLVSIGFAFTMWTRDDSRAVDLGDFTVWGGSPEDVTKVTFEYDDKKVVLEAHSDERGRWYTGLADKPPIPKSPHGAPPEQEEAPTGERVKVEFVSVGPAEKVIEAMAPLRALRAIGRIEEDREAEFGLDDPKGSLTVVIGETEHTLELGERAPGGTDRYARNASSGEVYVLSGEAIGDLEGADLRLMERDLHEWDAGEVEKATIVVGSRSRGLVRGGQEGKRFWATPEDPDRQDETIGNWMTKIDRLRPARYEEPPEGAEVVVRIEYAGRLGALGFLEIKQASSGDEGKTSYWITSERIRKHAEIADATAAGIVADLETVLQQ
jgi:hypothetical protein